MNTHIILKRNLLNRNPIKIVKHNLVSLISNTILQVIYWTETQIKYQKIIN